MEIHVFFYFNVCCGAPTEECFLGSLGLVWSLRVPPEASVASRPMEELFFILSDPGLSVPDPPWMSMALGQGGSFQFLRKGFYLLLGRKGNPEFQVIKLLFNESIYLAQRPPSQMFPTPFKGLSSSSVPSPTQPALNTLKLITVP